MKLDERLLRLARSGRVAFSLTVGLGVLAGAVTVGQAFFLSRAVSRVFLAGSDLRPVLPLLIALLLLAAGRAGLVWASEWAAHRLANRVKGPLRERLVAHLLDLGPAYIKDERTGELATTAVEGIEALDAYFRHYLPQLALAALVPATVLAFVFPLDWVSGVVLLLTAPLLPLFAILIGNTADKLTRRQWSSLSRMGAHLLDALQGLATLKSLGLSREQAGTIYQVSDDFRRATMGVLRVAFLSALVLEMVGTIATAVVAVQVGLRLLYGRLAFEQAFFVLILAPEFYLPLRALGTRFHAGMPGVAAAERIFQVLDTPPLVTRPTAVSTLTARIPVRFRLSFSGVRYAYDSGRRPGLDGVSLEISPGERVALVGPSGSGKTTLAYLLLRFLEPDQGTIAVNGQPLSELDPAAWRERIAWVPQAPTLFYGTIADNIRLARPEASSDEVAWAARQAHAEEFIQSLPQAYDTLIGERASQLSGGEAQRIALARAFLKDAPFLLLDEATANLDPETEALVQAALARLLAGRSALVIAHRLSTVFQADRIVVLDAGRVVETGTHQALLRQGGLYERLLAAYGGAG